MSFKEKHSTATQEGCDCEKKCKKQPQEDLKTVDEASDLQKENSHMKELLLRTAAEYDNFRKRSEKEKEAIYSDASSLAVLSILPLADSLDAAEKSAQSGSEEYKKGIELLKNQMNSALKSLKVEVFGKINDSFDPNIHNAISHQESEEDKQSFISAVYQKGYKIGNRVVRHAMVEVTN